MGRSPAMRAVLGLVIFLAVAAVGYFGTRFAQGAFAEDYRFTILVGETGQGLVAGSDVVARGVLVGEVGQITLTEDLQAEVEVILEPQYRIPADAQFAVVGKTLFGEKQLEIRFDGDPAQATAFVEDNGAVDDPRQVVEVQDVLENLDDLLGAINPDDLAVVVSDGLGAFDGQEDSIARAIDQGARATNVFSRSLDDQVPTLRDLSLVAEALGPVGDEFNRLGTAIDNGALGTISDNQARLEILFDELNRFSDQLDLVLELTRPDLDRMLIEGDNVSRVLFAYRPELAELLRGLDDYTDTIGNGGQTDEDGFAGLAAGFQILLEAPIESEVCGNLPPEIAGALPLCAGVSDSPDQGGEQDGGVPTLPLPVVSVPNPVDPSPEVPTRGGIEEVIGGVLGDLTQLRGGDR